MNYGIKISVFATNDNGVVSEMAGIINREKLTDLSALDAFAREAVAKLDQFDTEAPARLVIGEEVAELNL